MNVLRLVRRPDGVPAGPAERVLEAAGSTIGRAPDCDLVLDDPLRLVSRRHAWIVPQGDDAAVIRCISTSATLLVNGETLEPGGERVLRRGDRIRIGGFEVLLDAAEPVARAAPASPPGVAPLPQPMPVPAVAAVPAVASVSAPAPEPAAGRAPAPVHAQAVGAPVQRRLDRWFNLDTVADPLGPESPLPAADEAGGAQAARPAMRQPAPAAAFPAVVPMPPAPPEARPVVSPAPVHAMVPPQAQAQAQAPVPAVADAATADSDALRRAFLRGAGLDPALPIELDPAWMEHVGLLLRLATEGTVDLLRSRAVAKRSIRAEGTRIAARENNLLKFTPDAADALRLLLSLESRPGFLGAADAMRDAHEDLQLHQLAMVAGMRAAVFDLISRLGPDAVEHDEGPAQGLDKWFAILREAALWRRHKLGHARLLENLDDTFEAIFGREFVRAYEAQARRSPQGDFDTPA